MREWRGSRLLRRLSREDIVDTEKEKPETSVNNADDTGKNETKLVLKDDTGDAFGEGESGDAPVATGDGDDEEQPTSDLLENSEANKAKVEEVKDMQKDKGVEKGEDGLEKIKDVDITIKGPVSTSIAQLLMDEYGYHKKGMVGESSAQMSITTRTASIILSKEVKYQHNNTNKLGSPFIYITDNRFLNLARERAEMFSEINKYDGDVFVCIESSHGNIPDDATIKRLRGMNAEVFLTRNALISRILRSHPE